MTTIVLTQNYTVPAGAQLDFIDETAFDVPTDSAGNRQLTNNGTVTVTAQTHESTFGITVESSAQFMFLNGHGAQFVVNATQQFGDAIGLYSSGNSLMTMQNDGLFTVRADSDCNGIVVDYVLDLTNAGTMDASS